VPGRLLGKWLKMSLVVEQSYSLHLVFNRRDKLFKRLGGRFADKDLVGDTLNELVSGVCALMPASVPRPVVFQSMFDLVGIAPTRQMLFDVFWRLAANIPALSRSEPVHPWNSQHGLEVVPVQVAEVKAVRHNGRLVQSLLFQFLAGSACPLHAHQRWSMRKCAFLARRTDDAGRGFMFSRAASSRSKRVCKYPYRDARQLVGMRCLAAIDPTLSDDGPNFQEIKFTTSLSSHNRELIKRRARVDEGYVCPQGFNRTYPCFTCYIGRDECSASCHERTYEIDFCSRCEQQSYFDRKDFTGYCVNCAGEARKKKK